MGKGGKIAKIFLITGGKKELISLNRNKAINIINNYCSRHQDCATSGSKRCVNGYCTYSMGSFVVAGNPVSGGSFIITQSLFSTQLQHQLVFMLKQNGYSNGSTINLTTFKTEEQKLMEIKRFLNYSEKL